MNTKLLGSSLILAGTALGAGMLAIPMVLAQFGLLYGTLLMTFICFGTTYAALMLLEATLKTGGGLGLNSIARQTLGKPGQIVTNVLLYVFLLCLSMAYIIGAADLLSGLLQGIGVELTEVQSQIAFTLIAAIIIAFGTGAIEKMNRVLFFIMIGSLAVTVGFLLPDMDLAAASSEANYEYMDLIKTSAVLFTSFGSAVVIPSLVSYNSGASDKQLRNMVIIGSTIPLVCYLIWLYAVVGNLEAQQLTSLNGVDDLVAAFSGKSSWISTLLSIFTGLALLTSFFGVAISLFNQNRDTFKESKVITYGVTFVLPLAGALLAADQFLAVLKYAGLIWVVLAVFIPFLMVLQLRKRQVEAKRYTAEGGVVMLAFSLLFGIFIVISQTI